MRNSWTAHEDAVLREHYPKHGGAWSGWESLLPNRTTGAIHMRAYTRGLCYQGPCKGGYRIDPELVEERAAAAVAALGDWQATRLALLFAVAGKEVEW